MLRRLLIAVVVAALATLMAAPEAHAGRGGVDRPFRATLVGGAYWEIPSDTRPDCGPVTTFTNPTGRATHMGKVSASQSHCPTLSDYVVDGRMTLVAANGDELYGTYDYDPLDETNVIPITITGGSGRFEGASGSVTEVYTIEPQVTTVCTTDPFCFDVGGGLYLDFTVPWPWSATLTGAVSY